MHILFETSLSHRFFLWAQSKLIQYNTVFAKDLDAIGAMLKQFEEQEDYAKTAVKFNGEDCVIAEQLIAKYIVSTGEIKLNEETCLGLVLAQENAPCQKKCYQRKLL